MENQFNVEPKTEGLNGNNFYEEPGAAAAAEQAPPVGYGGAGEMPGQQFADPVPPQVPYMQQPPVNAPEYGYQNGMPPQYGVNQSPPPMYPPVQPGMPPMGAPVYAPPVNPNNGFSVAGLVLGILGIINPYVIFPLMSIIFSIIGQKKAKEKGLHSGIATGGLVCGIIGMIFSVAFIALIIVLIVTGNMNVRYYNGFISSLF